MMKDGKFILQGTVPQLIQKANGKVWELSVPADQAQRWETETTVANFRHVGDQVVLRLTSATKPAPQAISCESTLEDLYLFYFGTEEGEQ